MKKILFILMFMLLLIGCTKDFENPLDPTNGEEPSLYLKVFTDSLSADSVYVQVEVNQEVIVSGELDKTYYIEYGVSDERETDVILEVYDNNETIAILNTSVALLDTLDYIPSTGYHKFIVMASDDDENSISDSLDFRIDDIAIQNVEFYALEDTLADKPCYDLFIIFSSTCGINIDSLNVGDSRILFSVVDDETLIDTVVVEANKWKFEPETNKFSYENYSFTASRSTRFKLDYSLYDLAGNKSVDSLNVDVLLKDSFIVEVENTDYFGPEYPASILVNTDSTGTEFNWFGSSNEENILVEYAELFPGKCTMTNISDFESEEDWDFDIIDDNGNIVNSFTLCYDATSPDIEVINPLSYDMGNIVLRDDTLSVNIEFNEQLSRGLFRNHLSGEEEELVISGTSAQIDDIILMENLNNYEIELWDLANNYSKKEYQLCYYPAMVLDSLFVNEELQDITNDILTNNESLLFRMIFSQILDEESVEILFDNIAILDSINVEGKSISFNYTISDSLLTSTFSFTAKSVDLYGSTLDYLDPGISIILDNIGPQYKDSDDSELNNILNFPKHFTINFDEELEEVTIDSIKVNGLYVIDLPYEKEGSSLTFELTFENFSPELVPDSLGSIAIFGTVSDDLGNTTPAKWITTNDIHYSIDRVAPNWSWNEYLELSNILSLSLPKYFTINFDEELDKVTIDSIKVNELYVIDLPYEKEGSSLTFALTMENFTPELVPDPSGSIAIFGTVSDSLGNTTPAGSITDDIPYSIDRDVPYWSVIDDTNLDDIQNLPQTFSIEFTELVRVIDHGAYVNGIPVNLPDPIYEGNTAIFELNDDNFSSTDIEDSQGFIDINLEIEDNVGNSIEFLISDEISFMIDRVSPIVDNIEISNLQNIQSFPQNFSLIFDDDDIEYIDIDWITINNTPNTPITIVLAQPVIDSTEVIFTLTEENFLNVGVPDSSTITIGGTVSDSLDNILQGIITDLVTYSINRESPEIDNWNYEEFIDIISDSTETVTAYIYFDEPLSVDFNVEATINDDAITVTPIIEENLLTVEIAVVALNENYDECTLTITVSDLVGNITENLEEHITYSFGRRK